VCLWVCYIGVTCGRDYGVHCMLFLLYGHVEMGIFYQAGYDLFGSHKIKIDVCIAECQLSELIGTEEV
jgi:hypothetical protein